MYQNVSKRFKEDSRYSSLVDGTGAPSSKHLSISELFSGSRAAFSHVASQVDEGLVRQPGERPLGSWQAPDWWQVPGHGAW